jgi:cell division protein FtsI (penicillin-binding protein 3)
MNQPGLRIMFISAMVAVSAAAVIVRLFTVQVLHGDEYAARSKMQSQQRYLLYAQRGAVLDRNGITLAASTQNDLSLTVDVLGAKSAKRTAVPFLKRAYPLGEVEGPLIGYVGRDGYGLGGVEFSFDKYLRGEDGWTIVQKDGRNHRYRRIGMPYKEPRTGSAVYLTIDAEIQKTVYSVVKQSVAALKAKGGMGIVMDPFTGKILAMVSCPSFDPNFPGHFSLEERQNTCVGTCYEPGSTFKLVTAAAALQDNIKKERDVIDGNNGKFQIYNEVIRDHESFGKLTFIQALAHSSNVCFAKVATDVGSKRLYRYVQDFGFGARTGINLPGEECGIVHPLRCWSGRTLVTMAIGQEISVTFLQMMTAYAVVANGGILVKPQICEKIVSSDGSIGDKATVQPVRRVISEENAKRLGRMLRAVVDSGTGKNASIAGITIAGKTGTSQKVESGTYSHTQSWASFIGFFPVEDPVLLCGVVIDEPADNLMGGTAAAPAFKNIATQLISHPGLEYAERILNHRAASRPELAEALQKPALSALAGMTTIMTEPDEQTGSRRMGQIPDCIGKDARDAVNMMNLRNLVPYVIGAGIVRRQSLPAGGLTSQVKACTLVCSFGG